MIEPNSGELCVAKKNEILHDLFVSNYIHLQQQGKKH